MQTQGPKRSQESEALRELNRAAHRLGAVLDNPPELHTDSERWQLRNVLATAFEKWIKTIT